MVEALELSKEIFDTVREYRNFLHKNAELSFEEYNTRDYIVAKLEEMGLQYRIINTTSVVAILENEDDKHSNTIALRADIDALPITEDMDIEGRAEGSVMHACGHDLHTATLLGVAKLFSQNINKFKGTIVFVFQQGEELLPGGAEGIIKSNILDEYNTKLILGQHCEWQMNVGEFGLCEGLYMASGDELHFTVNGVGGHAAQAQNTLNPIYPACEMVSKINEIQSFAPKGIPSIISIGKFIAAGATNIIPESVKIEGTFRTMNEQWREEAKQKIREIAEFIRKKYSIELDINIIKGYSMLYNNVELAQKAKEILSSVGKVNEVGIRLTTEDFGAYSAKYKSLFYRFGIKNPNWERCYPAHTSCFRADDESLIYAVAGLYKLAYSFL